MEKSVTENGMIDRAEIISEDCDAAKSVHSEQATSGHSVSEVAENTAKTNLQAPCVTTSDAFDGCQVSGVDAAVSHESCQTVVSPTSNTDVDTSGKLPPARHVTLSSPIPSLVQSFRMSALKTMKRTRQSLAEKIGHGSKTVDAQLDARIESLRDIQRRYVAIMQLVNSFSTHFGAMVACHQALDAEFSDLAQKMPELYDEFTYNAETQRVLHKNGEILLGAVAFFSNTLNTLCFKTIEDTLVTVKQYEDARVEYDAYRSDVESKQPSPETQRTFQQHKVKFEQLRQILDIKFQLLDENRVKVMHQQLLLFHNATSAYFSGNQTALNDTLQQFSIPRSPPVDAPR